MVGFESNTTIWSVVPSGTICKVRMTGVSFSLFEFDFRKPTTESLKAKVMCFLN